MRGKSTIFKHIQEFFMFLTNMIIIKLLVIFGLSNMIKGTMIINKYAATIKNQFGVFYDPNLSTISWKQWLIVMIPIVGELYLIKMARDLKPHINVVDQWESAFWQRHAKGALYALILGLIVYQITVMVIHINGWLIINNSFNEEMMLFRKKIESLNLFFSVYLCLSGFITAVRFKNFVKQELKQGSKYSAYQKPKVI